MPRPARIQYQGAMYHVMNRGRGRQKIFHGPEYYAAFIQTLAEAHSRFDAQVHAYCLMDNHYHLLIATPRANLDRIMRHVNGVYTQRYNRLRRTDGTLFRGRYKAILVDKDHYLLPLGRYIHLNPTEVKGATDDALDQFSWSSYPAYINSVSAPEWLNRELTYEMLGQKNRYSGYRKYVAQGNSPEITQFYGKGNLGAVLGERAFKESIKKKQKKLFVSGDLSKALSECPDLDAIVGAVSKVFKVSPEVILLRRSGRQQGNKARQMAVYCCQQLGDQSLREMAVNFNYTHTGSVSTAIAATRNRMNDGDLLSEYKKIKKALNIKN